MSTIASHRATTSSRTPGRINRGTVRVDAWEIAPCQNCGALRYVSMAPHAPRFVGGALVDCVGTLLTAEAARVRHT